MDLTDVKVTRHKISALAIAFTCYSIVCGGPVGIEDSVGAGGAFATIAGLCAVALLWALPQSLITAELSTAIPTNGGSIDWVIRGLGPTAGLCNAYSLIFNQLFDLPLYPVLLAASLQQVVTIENSWWIVIQIIVVLLGVGLNILGLDAVTSSTYLLTIMILIPFFLLPVAAAAYDAPFDWTALAPAATPGDLSGSLGLFVSGIMWNMQGWTSVGNVAAEIANPQRVFPVGVCVAVVLVTLSYAYSVLFGVVIHADLSDWEDGYLVTVAQLVAPWLGVWTAVAASISSFSTFLSSIASYSRSLQACALAKYVPLPLLSRNMTRFATPVPSILLLGLCTCGLMFLDLSDLVIMDTTFSNINVLLTTAAFVRLRQREPNLPRPFHLAYGWWGVGLAVLPMLVLACFAFYAVGSTTWYALVVPIVTNVLLALGAWLFAKFSRRAVHVSPEEEAFLQDTDSRCLSSATPSG